MLRLEAQHAQTFEQVAADRLFHPAGDLRGQILFNGKEGSLLRWKPVGAVTAVRLANTRTAHIERDNRRASKMWPFDTARFRHTLHLKNGESIPCQISAYEGTTLRFRSPFISGQHIDSTHVKAIEFSGRTHTHMAPTLGKRTHIFGQGEQRLKKVEIHIQGVEGKAPVNLEKIIVEGGNIDLKDGKVIIMMDGKKLELHPHQNFSELTPHNNGKYRDPKLERALTVPAFQPRHAAEPHLSGEKR